MPRTLALTHAGPAADRLDRALAAAAPAAEGLSRSRLRALIEAGHVARAAGGTLRDPGVRVKPGEDFLVTLPDPVAPEAAPEAIPLAILHEDAHLLVLDKPAGLVVHPAPGAETGTLVNALLAHCGPSLAGIGGEGRPGIVHRIDRETSGLLVVAKTASAHQGLSVQFAQHTIERLYEAVAWGVPDPADPRLLSRPGVAAGPGGLSIAAPIGRHPTDRKRMAVVAGGRRAVTHVRVAERFGAPPVAALLECRLETGRTHQIRVHLAHAGHGLVGDSVYGRPRAVAPGALPEAAAAALRGFPRQALHAARLGFTHPATGARMRFASPLPADLDHLLVTLRRT